MQPDLKPFSSPALQWPVLAAALASDTVASYCGLRPLAPKKPAAFCSCKRMLPVLSSANWRNASGNIPVLWRTRPTRTEIHKPIDSADQDSSSDHVSKCDWYETREESWPSQLYGSDLRAY